MILVSDTSVLIDLERGGFLEVVFSLPDEFAVPDVLYHQEMQGEWGARLVELGLRVEKCPRRVSRTPFAIARSGGFSRSPTASRWRSPRSGRGPFLQGTTNFETSPPARTWNVTACCGSWIGWRKRGYPHSRRYTTVWQSWLEAQSSKSIHEKEPNSRFGGHRFSASVSKQLLPFQEWILCSVCAPLRTESKHRMKTGYSQSPERGAGNAMFFVSNLLSSSQAGIHSENAGGSS